MKNLNEAVYDALCRADQNGYNQWNDNPELVMQQLKDYTDEFESVSEADVEVAVIEAQQRYRG